MAKEWERVAENLVRHRASGGLYLRAKVGGKIIRRSLGTKSMRIGKMKRDDLLLQLRANEGVLEKNSAQSLEEAIAQVIAWYASQPGYQKKPGSLKYREEIAKVLARTLPNKPVSQWSVHDMTKWWGSPAVVRYSAGRRNNMLGTLRKMMELSIDQGTRVSDPTSRLKRIPVITPEVLIPSKEEFKAIISDINSQKKSHSQMAAWFVEFMTYSGCRPGETGSVTREDIEEKHIKITGGEGGTKNHLVRRVPIMGEMQDLLERMNYREIEDLLFPMTPPKDAIANACKRLGLPRYTPKTFRHVFGTTCLECGVPLATVADWMGHKDKGVTLARTYAHIRDEHGIKEAAKVNFQG